MQIRPIDQARAARLVMASMVSDEEMFATTLQETLADNYGFGELGSVINVLRTMADDLAGALVDVHGRENAGALLRTLVMQFVQAAEDTPSAES